MSVMLSEITLIVGELFYCIYVAVVNNYNIHRFRYITCCYILLQTANLLRSKHNQNNIIKPKSMYL